MPDNNTNQNYTPIAQPANAAPIQPTGQQAVQPTNTTMPSRAAIDSPWNEPLPQEAPKPQVTGTLTESQAKPQPFSVPENVEKTMPPVIKAADIVKPAAPTTPTPQTVPEASAQSTVAVPSSTPATSAVSTSQDPKTNAAFDYGFQQPAAKQPASSVPQPINADITPPAAKTVSPIPAVQQSPAVVNGISSLVKPINPAAMSPQTPVPAAVPMQPAQPAPIAPIVSPVISNQATPAIPLTDQTLAERNKLESFVVPGNADKIPSVTPPPAQTSTQVPTQVPTQQQQPKKIGLSRLFAGIKKRQPKENDTTAIPAAGDVSQIKEKISVWVYIAVGILTILIGLVLLTEYGILSIGLEKVYGAVGIEKLWGGLPPDSETALLESFAVMQDHQQFKVDGTIDMSIDKTMKNAVTTPLVSEGANTTLNKIAILPIKAILAATSDLPAADDPSVIWVDDTTGDTVTTDETTTASTDSSYTDTSSSATTSSLDSSTKDATISSDTASTQDASLESSVSDSQVAGSVYSDTSISKSINATVNGDFGTSGNNITIKIIKPIGSQTIELKNQGSNLWVKSDKVKFNDKAESGKWLLYNLASLDSSGVVSQVASIDTVKGFSTGGSRLVNEKVGAVRCYKYSLEDLEFGDSLSGLGIASDSIQNITGNIWIGVRDKLVRRLDLKITPSPSSPFLQITVSLKLSEYDSSNNFTKPSSTDVVNAAT